MRPMKLVLDFTKSAKNKQKFFSGLEKPEELWIAGSSQTILMLNFPNGEHAATFPEVRDPQNGRKAAKRFMKYCPNCEFTDRTKSY